ncbi:MAG: phosphoglucomutase/phosphomannomutase family protein [Candidatus Aminicenantes bacterium]|nr:phosphoglucomutase/phosphomannomutase family protein [Candidatus Aminicenantes bacterium]
MIRFGTSGWRAVMGEEFTFHNVRLVVQAIADHLRAKFAGRPVSVIVNYDTRFLSERYAAEAAKVLSHGKIHVLLADRDAPSQAQAHQIRKRGAQGGINFTASFNPPEYNGLKYSTETGAPAMTSETALLEAGIAALQPSYGFVPRYVGREFVEKIDLRNDYLAHLQTKVDFDLIRKSGLRVGVDLLYGTSREYLDEILEDNGIPVEEIHGYVDPYFGGIAPSCTEENMAELKRLVVETKCGLGIATDADGDRFGIVDQTGRVVIQNIALSLLLHYLVAVKGLRGGVARSVATTHLIDRIARAHGLPLIKTAVGFKHLADLWLRDEILFGGEESASFALLGHLPEKDGILAGLLLAEMLAATGRSLTEAIEDLFKTYGERVGGQKSIPLTPARERHLRRLIKLPPTRLAGRPVTKIETIDGIKFDFDGDDWLLLRLSGTEPIIRCYAEAGSRKDLRALIKAGMEKLP